MSASQLPSPDRSFVSSHATTSPTKARVSRGDSLLALTPSKLSGRKASLDLLGREGDKELSDLPDDMIVEIFWALYRIDSSFSSIQNLAACCRRFNYLASAQGPAATKCLTIPRVLGVFSDRLGIPLQQCFVLKGNVLASAEGQCAGTYPTVLRDLLRTTLKRCAEITPNRCEKLEKELHSKELPTSEEFSQLEPLLHVRRKAGIAESIPTNSVPGLLNLKGALLYDCFCASLILGDSDTCLAIKQKAPKLFEGDRYYLEQLPVLARKKLEHTELKEFKQWLSQELNTTVEQLPHVAPVNFVEAIQVLRSQGKMEECITLIEDLSPLNPSEYWRLAQYAAGVLKHSIQPTDLLILDRLARTTNPQSLVTLMFYCGCFLADSTTREQALLLSSLSSEARKSIELIRSEIGFKTTPGIGLKLFREVKILVGLYEIYGYIHRFNNHYPTGALPDSLTEDSPVRKYHNEVLSKLNLLESDRELFSRALRDLPLADLEFAAMLAPYLKPRNQKQFIERLSEVLIITYSITKESPFKEQFSHIPGQHSEEDVKQVARFILKVIQQLPQGQHTPDGINPDSWNMIQVWAVYGLIPLDIDMAITIADQITNAPLRQEIFHAILYRLEKLALAMNEKEFLDKARSLLSNVPEKITTLKLRLVDAYAQHGAFKESKELLTELTHQSLEEKHLDRIRRMIGNMMALHGFHSESFKMISTISNRETRLEAFRESGALTTISGQFEESASAYSQFPDDVGEEIRLVDGFNIAMCQKNLELAKTILPRIPDQLQRAAQRTFYLTAVQIHVKNQDLELAEEYINRFLEAIPQQDRENAVPSENEAIRNIQKTCIQCLVLIAERYIELAKQETGINAQNYRQQAYRVMMMMKEGWATSNQKLVISTLLAQSYLDANEEKEARGIVEMIKSVYDDGQIMQALISLGKYCSNRQDIPNTLYFAASIFECADRDFFSGNQAAASHKDNEAHFILESLIEACLARAYSKADPVRSKYTKIAAVLNQLLRAEGGIMSTMNIECREAVCESFGIVLKKMDPTLDLKGFLESTEYVIGNILIWITRGFEIELN